MPLPPPFASLIFAGVVLGADAEGPDANLASAEATPVEASSAKATPSPECPNGDRVVVVGYEGELPMGDASPKIRVLEVLERAFPGPCAHLTLRSMHRRDVARAVLTGNVDVGVVMIASPASIGEEALTTLPSAYTIGVDTVPLQPASYAVVARQSDVAAQVARQKPSYWVLVPVGAGLGVLALLALTLTINVRLPRISRWHEVSLRRLDPQLTNLQRAAQWMLKTASGRLMGVLWCCLGSAGLTLTFTELSAAEDALKAEPDYETGVALATYPGRDIYSHREGLWHRCASPHECLRSFTAGRIDALAGDRDVLCHHARQAGNAALEFQPGTAVPMLYTFFLPEQTQEQTPDARENRKNLLEAIRRTHHSRSPWRSCDDGSGI